MRNAVQRDIKLAKQYYFEKRVEQSKGDSGKLWANLRSLGYGAKGGGSSMSIVLEQEGSKVSSPLDVANAFNRFYTSVASNLVSLLPTASGTFSIYNTVFCHFHFNPRRFHKSFTLSPVSRGSVLKLLYALNPNKAVGLDGIPSRFLRDAAPVIVEPISHIINISILTETVPDDFKRAKVTPLYKKGSKLDVGNYRPVSILPVLSKLLEKVVNTQLTEFLEKNSILLSNQSGFRGRFSTDTCTIDLTDYVKSEISCGRMVGMTLIDLCKAFDTVNHDILLEKMAAMGVSSVEWFRSYLSQRSQCVTIGDFQSDFVAISCGVPQGSILGPQLFLLYINDMIVSTTNCKLSLYADDSALIFSHTDPTVIASTLSNELSSCKSWLIDNKLSLHVGKTECILFGSPKRLKRVRDFSVSCDGQLVNRVSSVKYL